MTSAIRTTMIAAALLIGASVLAMDGWETDFSTAQAMAKKEKKPILALFTGSDWCPYCIYLERDVLSKPEFKKMASKKYVLLYVDFPKNTERMTQEQMTANKKLLQRFAQGCGFPTAVIIAQNGMVLNKVSGFRKGSSVSEYMQRLQQAGKQ